MLTSPHDICRGNLFDEADVEQGRAGSPVWILPLFNENIILVVLYYRTVPETATGLQSSQLLVW